MLIIFIIFSGYDLPLTGEKIREKYRILSASMSRSQPEKTGKIFRSRFQYYPRIESECLASRVGVRIGRWVTKLNTRLFEGDDTTRA